MQDGQRRDAGFTLVELLVVIAILGILSAVAVFFISGSTAQSKKSACFADLHSVQVASEAYNAKNGAYAAGDNAAGIGVLVTAKFLRSAPVLTNGYTITYTALTGLAAASPACNTLP